MSAGLRASAPKCHVLREDPDLLEAVPRADRTRAVDVCTASVARIARSRRVSEWPAFDDDTIGLLVLEGLLVHRIGIEERFGAELLGRGDLLRPWEEVGAQPTLPHTTGWQVIEPARVAVLDAHTFAQYPELTGRLVGRALERSRTLVLYMAIVHQPRVEVRLHMLFWHLAYRWGQANSAGVLLPIRLSGAVLAELVAARRSTVSTSLGALATRNLVRPVNEHWLLAGEPPAELLQLQSGPRER